MSGDPSALPAEPPSDLERRLRAAFADHEHTEVSLPDARDAAVLVPIYGPDPTLIFTVRSQNLSSHKGQISFPGGRIDAADDDAVAAALREAEEEIALDPTAVTIVGRLDDLPTFVSGYVVSPIVGYLAERPALEPNPAEVASILEIPLDDLVDDIRREPGFTEGGRSFPTEAWVWEGHVIWGVTARLLRTLLGHLSVAGLTKPPGDTASWGEWPPPVARP